MTETQPSTVESTPSWFAEYRRSSHFRSSAALISAEVTVAALTGGVSYIFNSEANKYRQFSDSIETMLPAYPITKNQLEHLQATVAKEKTGGLNLDPRSRVSEMVNSYDTYPQYAMKTELRTMQEKVNHNIDGFKDLSYFCLGLSLCALALAATAAYRSCRVGKEKLY